MWQDVVIFGCSPNVSGKHSDDPVNLSWDKKVLTISEAYEKGQVFIKANIDRRQIVKAFYLGLLTFASSEKFVSKEWEVEYLKERLCKILNIEEGNPNPTTFRP